MPQPHAVRRDHGVNAVLEGVIASLVDDGYSATSIRTVAARAGVSVGALQHYFPTKSAMISAALDRVFRQIVEETAAKLGDSRSARDRVRVLLDRIWELHQIPAAFAFLELINAARSDAELARQVDGFAREGLEAIDALTRTAVPDHADDPALQSLVRISIAAIRGTAAVAHLPRTSAVSPSWPELRARLSRSFDEVLGEA